MAKFNAHKSYLDLLSAPAFGRLLDFLPDEDITILHVITKELHEKCKDHIVHGRQKSRYDRQKYLRDKSSDDENFANPSDRNDLRIARTEFIRTEHAESFPRYYTVRIDTNRLSTPEIREITDSYREFLTYKLIRREVDPETDIITITCIHVGFNVLKYIYTRDVNYKFIFYLLKNLRTRAPPWAKSSGDIDNLSNEKFHEMFKVSSQRKHSSELFFRTVTNNL